MYKRSALIGFAVGVFICILGVQVQNAFQKPRTSKHVSVEPIDQVGKKDAVQVQGKITKILPNTIAIEKIYRNNGEEPRQTIVSLPKDWVNRTQKELEDVLSRTGEWKIEKFSSEEVILSKNERSAEYLYILRVTEDQSLASYHLNPDGSIGEIDEIYNSIPLNLLSTDLLQEIKGKGKEFKSKEELNEYLESFHG